MYLRLLLGRELPDAVHAIVRIGSEHQAAAFFKGERLPHKFQSPGGVGSEDDGVTRRRPEERQDGLTCLRSVPSGQLGPANASARGDASGHWDDGYDRGRQTHELLTE